ncbi:hypothetical protein ICC18_01200 [Paenibacillus sp. WST5]|uniref:Uncharacterized protein n=1 Tax=Paenibacillus sedimenti TaxID=2770274 RepID=A0A926KKG2_9BACL|nr:hypothetical protein [Paenibacillus sedimenti]
MEKKTFNCEKKTFYRENQTFSRNTILDNQNENDGGIDYERWQPNSPLG